MTYCLAVKVNDGLVFASDSRTNAGVDYINTYSKMHTFQLQEDRVIVVLSSGNLATSQAVINGLRRDLEEQSEINLGSVDYLFDAAHYVGQLSQRIQQEHSPSLARHSINAEASFILGGQIRNRELQLYLVYPEGNYISASDDTPFVQIGETKYGKPILDRVIRPTTTLEDTARCALVSLDSTMRSNISVGPPIELTICKKDSLRIDQHLSLNYDTPLYRSLQKSWNDGIRRAFSRLPRFEWESPSTK
ncbi:MAG: proteasome-type protease [Gammaproteobacteria bacterium]|nr:proteasome-type protease [Gammaproteobacteria bacterium]